MHKPSFPAESPTDYRSTEAVDVSVFVKCYRHAPFIEQAIRSVATQQTEFRLEIIVSDDGSEDGSADVIRKLCDEFPDLIRAIYRKPSEAYYVKGQRSGNMSLLDALAEVRGRYIAVLDGDDYWTSRSKLQEQVTALEKNDDFGAAAHPVECVDPSGLPLRAQTKTKLSDFSDL